MTATARSNTVRASAARTSNAPRRKPNASAPKKPPLRVVESDERRAGASRRRGRRYIVFLSFFGVFSMFGLVATHVALAQNQMKLDAARAGVIHEQERFDSLRLEAAQLASPARVTNEAARLGLREPRIVQYLQPGPVTAGPAATTISPTQSNALDAPVSQQDATATWGQLKPELSNRP